MDYLTALQPYLGEWRGIAVTALHVIIILGLSWLALRLSRKGLRQLRQHLQQDDDDHFNGLDHPRGLERIAALGGE